MDKPYFAKYLPVEREIKDGILILDKDRNKVGKITYPDNADGIYHVDFLDETSGGCDHFVPVKFFLCSRDVQVGDKFRTTLWEGESESTTVSKGFVYNGSAVRISIGDCYKVIGEISPEATWVKEGDEFDEVRLFYYLQHGSSLETVMGVNDHQLFMQNPGAMCIAALKGPCGHFH